MSSSSCTSPAIIPPGCAARSARMICRRGSAPSAEKRSAERVTKSGSGRRRIFRLLQKYRNMSTKAAVHPKSSGSEGAHGFADDFAVEKMNGVVGETRVARVVRDETDGGAVLVKVGKKLHDGFAVLRIEISGWFVRHQNQRVSAESAGDGDALLLTAAELRGEMFFAVRHANAFQRVFGFFLTFGSAHVAIREREFDVFIDREIANQIERLKDKA